MTIHARVFTARRQLRDAGLSPNEADRDARLLAEHVLGWDAARYLTSASDPEPPDFQAKYEPLLARRLEREPVAYITGRQEFWDMTFEVSAAVLIPRPETELIVEAAIELIPSRDRPVTIVDACTGTGCVAVALARERPAARLIAIDISDVALDVARRNAARHGVADRVQFVQGDLLDPIVGTVDLIVCNPPYVAERDRRGLQPEVRDHEPAIALFGGRDGLHLITRLVKDAPTRLRSGAFLVFEFGFGQDVEIEALIADAHDLTMLGLRSDLQGIARTAVVERR